MASMSPAMALDLSSLAPATLNWTLLGARVCSRRRVKGRSARLAQSRLLTLISRAEPGEERRRQCARERPGTRQLTSNREILGDEVVRGLAEVFVRRGNASGHCSVSKRVARGRTAKLVNQLKYHSSSPSSLHSPRLTHHHSLARNARGNSFTWSNLVALRHSSPAVSQSSIVLRESLPRLRSRNDGIQISVEIGNGHCSSTPDLPALPASQKVCRVTSDLQCKGGEVRRPGRSLA